MEDDTKPSSRSKKIFLVAVPLVMVLLIGAFFVNDRLSVPADLNNRELPMVNALVPANQVDPSRLATISAQLERMNLSRGLSKGERLHATLRAADEYSKFGLYNDAIDAYQSALELAKLIDTDQAVQFDLAQCYAGLAECNLAVGNGERAYDFATSAFRAFDTLQALGDPKALSAIGILLESSGTPNRLASGEVYLNTLKHSPIARAPNQIQALAYMRAANFLKARMNNGQHEIIWDHRNASIGEIEQIYLRQALEAWQRSEYSRIKGPMTYNEAVIYNRLGLSAADRGDVNAAQRDFQGALRRLKVLGDTKDMARILLSLSDLQLKQHQYGQYIALHDEAKRMWTLNR